MLLKSHRLAFKLFVLHRQLQSRNFKNYLSHFKCCCCRLVTEAGKWIFELRRIQNELNSGLSPLLQVDAYFKLKNKFIFNIQLSTAALREKKER